MADVADVLIIGSGPAGLFLAAELAQRGLDVKGLSPVDSAAPWPNTYGIWADELKALGINECLEHRWQNTVAYMGKKTIPLKRDYGLIDREKLQGHWLQQGAHYGVSWHRGKAVAVTHSAKRSEVTDENGTTYQARLVVDTSGHNPALIKRVPAVKPVAYQAAYGVVGRFSAPPVEPEQMVLMDYRDDFLPASEKQLPPTFLYAMDLGNDVYFVEETSLAHVPGISMASLEQRLHRRLAHRGVRITESHHIERCFFPMNMPLPDLTQAVVGFGGSASMVHPATGYMQGAMLRRGPDLANAIARRLGDSSATPVEVASAAWQVLWSEDRLRKHYLYTFGLENLMAFKTPELQQFFTTFFELDQSQWAGFLADTSTLPEIVQAMLVLFGRTSNPVRWGLFSSVFSHGNLLRRTITA
ncbi:lycopene cyclase family protein [Synechococcus sp. PCC 7335]|uniref:lycopene beta cyclase n=1 Tax=Synechococcus sp. (strain ATCC 29403 / PCC 7335) TaxID=91464 RepID=UPI00017EB0E1|nr:lycopene cyclase family protein [Synechococcus sp. PCC 7335]EDX85066.1 lycopene cyclase family protein [Synechococcus sp. PCC 7335]